MALFALHAELSPYPYGLFVPENMSYSLENFTHQNQTFQAITIQGQVYAILSPNSPDYVFEPISNLGEITPALGSYYLSQGYSPDSVQQLAKTHEGIDSIRNVRKKGEADCRILLGTDRHTCDSFEHCLQACYSVTSFCMPVALGAGRGFVNTMWEFENNSLLLDAAYDKESAIYSEISTNATGENLKAYMGAIEEINRRSTKAATSLLYDYYSFCFSPEYSMSTLTNLQLQAQRGYANFSRFYDVDSAAQNVRNLTIYGIKKRQYLEGLNQPSQGGSNSSNISKQDSDLLEKYKFLNSSQAIYRLGPYNQTEARKQSPTDKIAQAEQHFNLPTLALAALGTIAVVGGLVFLFFKLRKEHDDR